MSKEEKILISKGCIDKVKSVLSSIRLTSKDKSIKRETEELLKLLDVELNNDNLSLEKKILAKMKETKGSDPDMNANLYILHRKLASGQITEEQALELFEMYVKIEPYDTKIF